MLRLLQALFSILLCLFTPALSQATTLSTLSLTWSNIPQISRTSSNSASSPTSSSRTFSFTSSSSPSSSSSSSSSRGASASASASAPGATHTVLVGLRDHIIDPDVIQASVGDIVRFVFFPANHSIARSEYLHPCVPREIWHPDYTNGPPGSSSASEHGGFFSGFVPVDETKVKSPPAWDIQIRSLEPTFFYCSAPGSCPNFRMVGVINPNISVSFEEHKKLAGQSRYSLQPGQVSNESEMIERYGPEFDPGRAVLNQENNQARLSSPLSTGSVTGIALGMAALIFGLASWGALNLRRRLKQAVSHSGNPVFSLRPSPASGPI